MSPITATPPAPGAAPAAPAAPQASRFFPTGPAPSAPAAPAVPAVPAAPQAPASPNAPAAATTPTSPDPRSAFFGATPTAQGAAAAAPSAPGTVIPEFKPDEYVSNLLKELLPDSLIKDPEALKNLTPIRDALAKATARATSAEMKFARAHQAGASVVDQGLKDKLTAAEAKLTEFEPKIGRLSLLEARAELADNDAFTSQYVDKLTGLKKEALAIAKEAGLDAAVVEKAFSAESKLGAAKAFAEVTDAEAKGLLLELARQSLDVAAKFRSEWKDPIKALETWRGQNAQRGVQQSAQNSEQAVSLHKAAVQTALQGDAAKGVPANFALAAMLQSPQGAAILAQIEAEYAGNKPIPPGQVFFDRVQAATVPHLVNYTVHLEAQLAEAMQKLAQYGALQPGGYASPGQQAGTAPAGQPPSKLWGQAPQRVGPVIQAALPGQMPGPAVGMAQHA